tara:strand:+ start:360 stop:2162 length:1803 start_codon:yes stop_codon:yes gene_type:complete
MATVTLTKKGISVTVSSTSALQTGYYHDGNPWICLSGALSSCLLTYSPPRFNLSSLVLNGAGLNVAGNNQSGGGAVQGFDGRPSLAPYLASLNASASPLLVNAVSTIIIGKSAPPNSGGISNNRTTLSGSNFSFNQPGRSYILESMAVTVVSSVPPSTAFRPGAFGPVSSRVYWDTSNILWQQLPDTISAVATTPTYNYLSALFSDFCGEVLDLWATDQITPDYQHPGYGQYFASVVSQALCKVMEAATPATLASKRNLAVKLIQWGIDLWSAFKTNRTNFALGGHMQGRKALIIFAGHMLGDSSMENPDAILADQAGFYSGCGRFQEKHAYFASSTASSLWWGGRWAYNYTSTSGLNPPARGFQALDPSTWSNDQKFQWIYSNEITAGSQVGTALAMMMLRRHREWSIPAIGYITQWMHGWTTTLSSSYVSNGLSLQGIGTSGGVAYATQFQGYCTDLWRVYRFTNECSINNVIKYLGSRTNGGLLTCNDQVSETATINLEILGAPVSGVSSCLLLYGSEALSGIPSGAATLYVNNLRMAASSVPITNSYGAKIQTFNLAPFAQVDATTPLATEGAFQFILNLTDGTTKATNAIVVKTL